MQTLRVLSDLTRSGVPLGRAALQMTDDGVLTLAEAPPPSSHRFLLDGLQYHVLLAAAEGGKTRFQIWAELGVLPFSVEDRERRRTLLHILQRTHGLPTAKFVLQANQKILVLGDVDLDGTSPTPDDILYHTVALLREARPFVKIFADHVTPARRPRKSA